MGPNNCHCLRYMIIFFFALLTGVYAKISLLGTWDHMLLIIQAPRHYKPQPASQEQSNERSLRIAGGPHTFALDLKTQRLKTLSPHIYIYIHMCICICMYVHIQIYEPLCTCRYTSVFVYIHFHIMHTYVKNLTPYDISPKPKLSRKPSVLAGTDPLGRGWRRGGFRQVLRALLLPGVLLQTSGLREVGFIYAYLGRTACICTCTCTSTYMYIYKYIMYPFRYMYM